MGKGHICVRSIRQTKLDRDAVGIGVGGSVRCVWHAARPSNPRTEAEGLDEGLDKCESASLAMGEVEPLGHESADKLSNVIRGRIEREMTAVDNVNLSAWYICAVGFRL